MESSLSRPPREIWTPAKRDVIREWHVWVKKDPSTAEGDRAFGNFYLHLERNSAGLLLTFSADNKFEIIRAWLAEEGLIKV